MPPKARQCKNVFSGKRLGLDEYVMGLIIILRSRRVFSRLGFLVGFELVWDPALNLIDAAYLVKKTWETIELTDDSQSLQAHRFCFQ